MVQGVCSIRVAGTTHLNTAGYHGSEGRVDGSTQQYCIEYINTNSYHGDVQGK